MSQLNFYVPDEIEEQIRETAKKEGKTISSFLADLVKASFPEKKWETKFFTEVAGAWDGEFPKIDRPLPDERDNL